MEQNQNSVQIPLHLFSEANSSFELAPNNQAQDKNQSDATNNIYQTPSAKFGQPATGVPCPFLGANTQKDVNKDCNHNKPQQDDGPFKANIWMNYGDKPQTVPDEDANNVEPCSPADPNFWARLGQTYEGDSGVPDFGQPANMSNNYCQSFSAQDAEDAHWDYNNETHTVQAGIKLGQSVPNPSTSFGADPIASNFGEYEGNKGWPPAEDLGPVQPHVNTTANNQEMPNHALDAFGTPMTYFHTSPPFGTHINVPVPEVSINYHSTPHYPSAPQGPLVVQTHNVKPEESYVPLNTNMPLNTNLPLNTDPNLTSNNILEQIIDCALKDKGDLRCWQFLHLLKKILTLEVAGPCTNLRRITNCLLDGSEENAIISAIEVSEWAHAFGLSCPMTNQARVILGAMAASLPDNDLDCLLLKIIYCIRLEKAMEVCYEMLTFWQQIILLVFPLLESNVVAKQLLYNLGKKLSETKEFSKAYVCYFLCGDVDCLAEVENDPPSPNLQLYLEAHAFVLHQLGKQRTTKKYIHKAKQLYTLNISNRRILEEVGLNASSPHTMDSSTWNSSGLFKSMMGTIKNIVTPNTDKPIGVENTFYYDEAAKIWRQKGVENNLQIASQQYAEDNPMSFHKPSVEVPPPAPPPPAYAQPNYLPPNVQPNVQRNILTAGGPQPVWEGPLRHLNRYDENATSAQSQGQPGVIKDPFVSTYTKPQ